MSLCTLRRSLWLIPLTAVLARCSVEFFISQAPDQCGKGSDVITCENNTNRGGLCAYAQDVMKLWCCPAMAPSCWSRGENCTGGSLGTPGPGQISCSAQGAQWCCNQEYEACTWDKSQTNTCVTNFANENANIPIAEANAVESLSASAMSSASLLSTVSSTLTKFLDSTIILSPTTILSPTSILGPTTIPSPITILSLATILSPTTALSLTTVLATASAPLPASASPSVSKSVSALAPGAIAGIVIAVILAVALILGLLVYGQNVRARKRLNKEGQPMRFREITMVPQVGDHSLKSDLHGKRPEQEMPAQEMVHEMF